MKWRLCKLPSDGKWSVRGLDGIEYAILPKLSVDEGENEKLAGYIETMLNQLPIVVE